MEKQTLEEKLKVIRTLQDKLHDLDRTERWKMNGEAGVAMACKNARKSREEIETLDKQIDAWPNSTEYAYLRDFLRKYTQQAAELPGNLDPPVGNLTHVQEYPMLLSACINADTTPQELVAVAWLRAARSHPEIFKEGCDDPVQHQARIDELRQEISRQLQAAANSLVLSDFRWTGIGKVSYSLSDGQCPAGGPGNPRGLEALIGWMRQRDANPPDEPEEIVEEQEEGEYGTFLPTNEELYGIEAGKVRRV